MTYLLLLGILGATPLGPVEPIDLAVAKRYFHEAERASKDDGGELWGRALYGPILFVDPSTRFVVGNQSDNESKLQPKGVVWVGKVEGEVGIANTATEWAGVRWTMVVWPPGDATAERTRLLLHECFHRIQEEIGLPSVRPANDHLDTKDGRIWLKLEYRALSKALISWGPSRKAALTDALAFRARRQALFPGAKRQEDRMEMHEGMAEYTGIHLMGLADWGRRSFLSGRLKVSELKPSYPFSFAYETGPAYGLLLDMDKPGWRSHAGPATSLADTLMEAAKILLPPDSEAYTANRVAAYDGQEVLDVEEAREQERLGREKMYRSLLVDGPVLKLPLKANNATYNPNEIMPLGDRGTVYPTTRLTSDWGVIEATKGLLMAKDFTAAYVTAPRPDHLLEGDGWKLTLKPGWKVVSGLRPGDYVLKAGSGSP